jgi:uncharacterized protein (TIGR02757 family)
VAALKPALDRLYAEFNHAASVSDPVEIVRRYPNPADREVVGFCAAALAFGRVASVLGSIERLLACMGEAPARFAHEFDPARHGTALDGLGHRWIRGRDLSALLWIIRAMIDSAGSIEAFLAAGLHPDAADVGPALDSFSARACAIDLRPVYGRRVPAGAGVRYFFPRPSAGSGCKRLNLYLRWMVRKDAVDLGVWTRVPASKLIIPLDTHVIRVGRCLRLTRYTTPGWRMAAEITASLRELDPEDPVRYDFSLCHLGMMNACGFNRAQGDAQCPLRGACRPRARRGRAFRGPFDRP